MIKEIRDRKIIIFLIIIALVLLTSFIIFYRTAYNTNKIELLICNHIQAVELKENSPEDKVYEVHKILGEHNGFFLQTKYICANTKTYEVNSKSYSDHLFPIKITFLKLGNKVNIISSYVPDDGEAFPKGFERHFPKEITNQYYNNLGNIAKELNDKMKELEIK